MKIGYALSGGGARGAAHLGIIKVLEEEGIRPAMISGTSAGSIIGAYYAAGYDPDRILEILSGTSLIRVLGLAFNLKGLLTLDKTEQEFLKFFPDNSFSKLQIPLIVAATNIRTGKITYFSDGELIKPVLASSAIPVIFNPVIIDGEMYIDGGVLNNMPSEPLIGHCDKILGMHCNAVNRNYSNDTIKGLVERTFLLAVNTNIMTSKQYCDIFMEPTEVRDYGALEFGKLREIFQIGYEYASARRKHLLTLLEE